MATAAMWREPRPRAASLESARLDASEDTQIVARRASP